ncbi:MAG: putative metal-binding motif-containing protein [Pseudomonadota bacterium]
MDRTLMFLAALALTACRTKADTGGDTDCHWYRDADADGYGNPNHGTDDCDPGQGWVENDQDCDDSDDAIHPGAEEHCDGVDENCDRQGDLGAVDASILYQDTDGDGWGDSAVDFAFCEQPEGWVADPGDCDEANPEVHPEAPERCNEVDDDCDGEVDEEVADTWYRDADGDGFGDAEVAVQACDPGPGWVADATDCDDDDAQIHPGAEETCDGRDEDCDGAVDDGLELTWYADADGDGYGDPETTAFTCDPGPGWGFDASDCDDANSAISPAATERCDGYDDDCDGLVDDDDPDVTDPVTWYLDGDGDGYGLDTAATAACVAPSGYAAFPGDCDDTSAAFHPGAPETDCADPNDYNCDGVTGYVDSDGDGWAACVECDDGDASVYPGAPERCDGVDDDCDGTVDEADAIDAPTWYADSDRDGYGDAAAATVACTQPSGTVSDATDCDDTRSDVHPGAPEVCDGVDDDCDGAVDVGAIDADTWYPDADGDGYGDAAGATAACSAPSGYLADGRDCDDGRSDIHPSGLEVCDGLDNDCDGAADEADAADILWWYDDDDGDGYGDPGAPTAACTQPSGTVADSTDCDDTLAATHPGAAELCDGLDNDCDTAVDEGAAAAPTWYRDRDSDGFGDAGNTRAACTQPSGYVADATDCDDSDADIHPGATEHCDGADEDCDGDTDELDEVVDATSFYPDADGDGYGAPATALDACTAPSGYSADGSDCDDADEDINPAAEDVCDGVDNDCDGVTDPDPVPLDADGDGTYNCLDSTIYVYDFDDGAWTGWTYVDLAGGNTPRWSMSGGTLHEASNAAHSIAYGPDLGDLYHYTVSAEVMAQGLATNGAALVFGYEASDTYLLARWLDPNDYYGSYANRGRVDLYRCDAGTCSVLATDDGSRDLSQPSGTWISMAVEVDDEQVTVVWDGVELLTADLHSRPIGAAHVGVWTFDNDGGVYYDDFTVTGP